MLSLITGNPGMGKTSLMVHMLVTNKDLKDRTLYVDGIPDLKIKHEPIPDGHSVLDWYEWVTPGSILVIDEAQRVFRRRPAGSKVPEHVAQLETHRHLGVDIFILTQNPSLIDVNVRSLIGEHRHISRTLLGLSRVAYWPDCALNPTSASELARAKVSVFRLKKDVFGLYKSAEEHTKIKGAKSIVIYILPISILIVIAMSTYQYYRFKQRLKPEPVVPAAVQYEQQQPVDYNNVPASSYGAPVSQSRDTASGVVSDAAKPLDFEPVVEGQAWTAPAYSSQNHNVQTMPFPVACVKNANKCTCYTDQATPLLDMKKSQCLDFVEHGIYNPYKQVQYSQSSGVVSSGSGGAVVQTIDGDQSEMLKVPNRQFVR